MGSRRAERAPFAGLTPFVRAGSDATPSLPARIQRRLGALYGIDAPSVDGFVRAASEGREVLEVRKRRGSIELALHLPKESLAPDGALSIDVLCQVAEGVSHFLYLAERSRRELPATHLELELQAEVDKFLLLAGVLADKPVEGARLDAVFSRLFDRIAFLHPAGTESGDRYRLANTLAARFARRVTRDLRKEGVSPRLRVALRRFFEAGQREKIELAAAA
jgi:hypothetical protein